MILPLLLAALSAPGPSVRYFEATGEIRRDPVAEVLEEGLALVRVRLADGREKEIPGKWVLDLQREREEVPEEGILLRARRDVESGLRLEEARLALEKILPSLRGWAKEYAEAARADLACQTGEPGAQERVDAFLKERPESRFHPAMLLARARILDDPAEEGFRKQRPLVRCFREIGEKGGSRLVQTYALIEPARRVIRKGEEDTTLFLHMFENTVNEKVDQTEEIPWRICLQSAKQWVRIEYALAVGRTATSLGEEPRGARHRLQNIRDDCRYLLPEVNVDVLCALAEMKRLCGEAPAAEALLGEARDLAPDIGRRERVAAALEALRKPAAPAAPPG